MTTWTTGEAAEKCGLSQHTLRCYERIGLLGTIERGRGRPPPVTLLDAKITHYGTCLAEAPEKSNI